MYKIKSPNGNIYSIPAINKEQAINIAVQLDNFKYSNLDYFKLN